MGQALQPEVSLIALVFVLGLKHGLDPDHLVTIDGFTRTTRSRWCGFFFSLGHGLVVTLVSVTVALVAAGARAPGWLELSGAWISIGVLTLLGGANLIAAVRTPAGRPVALVGARGHWLPARLAQASHPAVIAAVGAAFAISFDTVSHALLFSASAGWALAALLGSVFTLGMMATDALNGWWIARLVAGADRRAAAASRLMSIAIAVLCLALAAYGLARYVLLELAAPVDAWAPFVGVATCAVVLAAYLAARRLRDGRIAVPHTGSGF
jgi:nickel/cobalt transporter (NiCoT) family protein